MITGTVTANREAFISLRIPGPSGQEEDVDAIVDTGFTGTLTLPFSVISSLGLHWLTQGQAILANGQLETFDVYRATVIWDGQPLRIMLEAAETDPLVGMTLMYGYDIFI
jgi:clan AA aspartic protease